MRLKAKRALAAAPSDVKQRLDAQILALSADPRPRDTRKLRGTDDTYRVRVGSWRIVYLVDDRLREVRITHVGHRRDVYR